MFFNARRVEFVLSEKPGTLTLSQALAGDVGRVTLGSQGVGLWTPNTQIPSHQEIVCDVRYEAISDAIFRRFIEAGEGHFLPAHVVLFLGRNPKKIHHALEFFDYVLVPDSGIKNTPADFRNRILGYQIEK